MPHFRKLECYKGDEKCEGVLSTELFTSIANAFHHAQDSGQHNQVIPQPKDLNSELSRLLSYKKESSSKVRNQTSLTF